MQPHARLEASVPTRTPAAPHERVQHLHAGSSYGDLADIGLSFVSFHLVVFLFMLHQRSWNLPAVILLVLFEVSAGFCPHACFAV